MFDLARIRVILVAACCVGVPLWLIHLGLTQIWHPARVASYQSTITPGAPENVLRKIAEDLKQSQGTLAPPGSRLGVVIGASTGFMASNTYVLQQETGAPLAWYGYFQTGGNGCDQSRLVKLLRRYDVKPDTLVLLLNPFMMADSDLRAERGFFPNVQNFNRQCRNFLLRTKTNFLAWFGQDRAEVACSANVLPERGFFRADLGLAAKHQAADDNAISAFRKLGFFDPETYPIGGINYRALVDLVRRERRRGTKVIAVILPESTRFRGMFPPEAKRSLVSALESCVGNDRPVIFDFSNFLDDSLFMDSYHISPQTNGSIRFSAELGRRIRSTELGDLPPALSKQTVGGPGTTQR
jgi:hypothetical protein